MGTGSTQKTNKVLVILDKKNNNILITITIKHVICAVYSRVFTKYVIQYNLYGC